MPLKNSYIFSDNMETTSTVTLHLNDESIRDFVYRQQSPDSDFGYPGTWPFYLIDNHNIL